MKLLNKTHTCTSVKLFLNHFFFEVSVCKNKKYRHEGIGPDFLIFDGFGDSLRR